MGVEYKVRTYALARQARTDVIIPLLVIFFGRGANKTPPTFNQRGGGVRGFTTPQGWTSGASQISALSSLSSQ